MVEAIDHAEHQSVDPPQTLGFTVVESIPSGAQGRPRIHIDAAILTQALDLCPLSVLARRLGVSARTIRRRALEYRLVEPCGPVKNIEVDDNGVQHYVYRSYTPRMSQMTDEQIDTLLQEILIDFPNLGCQMIIAQFRVYGMRISCQRI